MTFEGDSGLIVPVPEADPVIHRWRLLHDSAAQAGVPAHITVLYPFVPRVEIDGGVETAIRLALEPFTAFAYRFAEVRWFGEDVAYVAPEPDEPFRDLTKAMWDAFPQHPPYEGAHEDPTPHMTIGHSGTGDIDHAAQMVGAALPIEAVADRVELILLEGSRWSTAMTFCLRQDTDSSRPRASSPEANEV